jgi:tetratricopeptide (TPR) repeat protein
VLKPTGYAIVLLGTVLLSGCATDQRGSLAARFVRPGAPTVDFGGPPAATSAGLHDQMKKVMHPASNAAPPRNTTLGATIEGSDPQLAAALLLERMLPSAASHLRVAQEYSRLGVLDAAYGRLNRAIEKAPRWSEPHEWMARTWRAWGLPERGLGAAYRAAYYEPESASAQNTLGTIFERLERFDDARRAYERAIALDPAAAWALNNLCHVEFLLGRLDEARSRCEAALTVQPNLAAAHNNLALTFAAAGDLDRARQEFLAAGGQAAADYNLGIIYLANQEYASAADSFEDAIKARPTFNAAKARAHDARMRALTVSE